MYLSGTILESSFNWNNVPNDTNSNDNVILKSNNIASENWHQAKILSSTVQIYERRPLINSKRIREYEIKKKLYESEQSKFELNTICERKFIQIVCKEVPDLPVERDSQGVIEYQSIWGYLTLSMLHNNMPVVRNSKLKAFVKSRCDRSIKRAKISYGTVSASKDLLVRKCIKLKDKSCGERLYMYPVFPELLGCWIDIGTADVYMSIMDGNVFECLIYMFQSEV